MIDVLRAASTIIVALENGIKRIAPIGDLKQNNYKNGQYLLIGEENGKKLEDFDLGNSPTQLKKFLQNSKRNYKNLIIKTTNATKVLSDLNEAYIVSTLNLRTAIDRLKGKDISIIMCGGKFGIREDMVVGLSLYGNLLGNISINYEYIKSNILASNARKHLEEIGYIDDVKFIVKNINSYNILPKFKNGYIDCD